MAIIKIVACALVCAILSQLFNQNKEIQTVLIISSVAICAFFLLDSLTYGISEIKDIVSSLEIDLSHIETAIKCIGVIYISELSSSVCRDSGNSALASLIDISCRATLTLICFPLYKDLILYVKKILEI